MGHHISALVSTDAILKEKAEAFDLPVFQESGVTIFGLNPHHSDYWAEKTGIGFGDGSTGMILDCPITHFFAKEIGLSLYILLETNYSGGVGDQSAGMFKQGLLLESSNGHNAINKMLRSLGLVAESGFDEFESAGLSKYRSFDRYFEKYLGISE